MIRNAFPREGLLRPISEWYVVFSTCVAGLSCLYAYEYFYMSKVLSYFAALFMFFIAVIYLRDALLVRRYQKNLKRLTRYSLNMSKVPYTTAYVMLGKGFRWLPIHTQRLRDTYRTQNSVYISDADTYTFVRQFCIVNREKKGFVYLIKFLEIDSMFNPFRPLPDVGGVPAIHGIEPNETTIIWPTTHRQGHTGVFGATGVGKTRLAEIIIDHDIKAGAKKLRNAVNNGNVTIIIDPKGDGELLRRCIVSAIEADRLDEFYMFHLGFPDLSCEYNPIADYQKITEVAGRSTNQLAGEGSSAAFKEFSWRFVNINAQAIQAVGEVPSYEKLSHYVSNTEEILEKYLDYLLKEEDPDWNQAVLEIESSVDDKQAAHMGRSKKVIALTNLAKDVSLEKDDAVLRGLVGALEYSKSYYDKIVASLLPFLDKMNTGKSKDLLSPGLGRNKDKKRMTIRDVIDRKGVLYVGLDALTDPVVAVAVASAMISDIVSVAGEIYKTGTGFGEPILKGNQKTNIYLHLDEFNELITGDEIIQILNKARGAGVVATLYTQTMKDIEAKTGSSAKAAQIIGNLQNILMMRVRDIETAELLTLQLPKVEVSSVTNVGGTKDSGEWGDFQTDNSDRDATKEEPMLSVSDITSLSKGQAFLYKNGGELTKVRFPMPEPDKVNLPKDITAMIAAMKADYQTGESWGDRISG